MSEFENSPSLGFYYTIALFDQLSNTYPNEAKQMIEAVLSFDTMGRYLSEEGTIIVDREPFGLEKLLAKHSIDTSALKIAATLNQLNTVYIRDEVRQIEKIALNPIPFLLPNSAGALDESTLVAFRQLKLMAERVRTCESNLKQVARFSFDFSLLSKSPTEENVQEFLWVVSELFFHAKLQDSSKLDIIGVEAPHGAKLNEYSTVSFLQNTVDLWLSLSLVQAMSAEIFDKRMRFIVAVLVEVNKPFPALPSTASADIYVPFVIFSSIVMKSSLQFHPSVQSHLVLIREMSMQLGTAAITRYTNGIKLSSGGETVPLSPMRMSMTGHLALIKEIADLYGDTSPERIAHHVIMRGKVVYSYFKPPHRLVVSLLSNTSDSARGLFNELPGVRLLSSVLDFYGTLDLMDGIFAIHNPKVTIAKQLQLFENALLSDHPRIYIRQKRLLSSTPGHLRCLENTDALHLVEKEVKNLLRKIQRLKHESEAYKIALTQWGTAIAERVEQLQGYDQPSEAVDGAKHLRRMGFFGRGNIRPDHLPKNFDSMVMK